MNWRDAIWRVHGIRYRLRNKIPLYGGDEKSWQRACMSQYYRRKHELDVKRTDRRRRIEAAIQEQEKAKTAKAKPLINAFYAELDEALRRKE